MIRAIDAFRIFDNIYVLTDGAHGTASVSIVAYNNLIRGLNLGIGSTLAVAIVLAIALIALLLVRVLGSGEPDAPRAWR